MAESLLNTNHQIKTISFTSGKGGVGKSTLVANIAHSAHLSGKRVLVLDADLGMANIDIMFGVKTSQELLSVIEGKKGIHDVVQTIEPGLDLIPGGSGLYELSQLDIYQKRNLMDQISDLESRYDLMIIDTAPGIDDKVLYFNAAAQNIYVIITPDPSSLVDSYALIKLLNKKYKQRNFHIICNMVKNEIEAYSLFRKLSDISQKFISVSLKFDGFVPYDNELRKAVKEKQLVVARYPRCLSSFSIKKISNRLINSSEMVELKGGVEFFWQKLVDVA